MKMLRFGLTLALAACALPASAQVPAMAGVASDAPMPPEPGQRTTTDRTLEPHETDLPQADIVTLSEQQELQTFQTNLTADLDRLDREYAEFEARSSTLDAEMWSTAQRNRTAARTRFGAISQGGADAFKNDREAMVRDYGAYNSALYRIRLGTADEAAYDRMVRDRMDWYGREIGRMSARMGDLPTDRRAEHALEMIRLRRQHDDLALRHRRLGRAPVVERDALRRQLTDDLARFDTTVRTSGMGWDGWASGSTAR